VIVRVRPALVVSLLIVTRLALSPTLPATAQSVLGHEGIAGGGLRVVLGTDPKTGQRYVHLIGRSGPTYPTIDITCDGKRWTLPLKRSEGGLVYEPSKSITEAMLGAIDCRMFLPDQDVALTRSQIWAAWASPGRNSEAPHVLVGQVVEVIDGNTIRVNLAERAETVRYIGINVKDSNRPTKGPMPAGGEAAEANRQLVGRQQVRLETDTQERDREGRLLAYVYVGDRMVNAELVRRGSAEIMTIQPNVRHRDLFVSLEQEARDDRRGLWADQSEPTTSATPPATLAQAARPAGDRPGVPPESAGTCPLAQPIKGNFPTFSSVRCIFRMPDSELYGATKPERCYATVDDAQRDGCQAARR
jgi:micrococcal nuclease